MDVLPYDFILQTLQSLEASHKCHLTSLAGLWGGVGRVQDKYKVNFFIDVNPKTGRMAIRTYPPRDLSVFAMPEYHKYIATKVIRIEPEISMGSRTCNFSELQTVLSRPLFTTTPQTLEIRNVHRKRTKIDIAPVINAIFGNFSEIKLFNVKFFKREIHDLLKRILNFAPPLYLEILNSDISEETFSLLASNIKYFSGCTIVVSGCYHRFHISHLHKIYDAWIDSSFEVLIRCSFPYGINSLPVLALRLGDDFRGGDPIVSNKLRRTNLMYSYEDGDLCIQLEKHN